MSNTECASTDTRDGVRSRAWIPSGKASLKTALFATGTLLFGVAWLIEIDLLLSVFTALIGIALGGVAFVLGVMAILGMGKYEGTTHPVAGVVGLMIGSVILSIPVVAVPIGRSFREAEQLQAWRNLIIREAGLNPNHKQISLQHDSVILRQPGPNWLLGDIVAAEKINEDAKAVALRVTAPGESQVLGLIYIDRVSRHHNSVPTLRDVADDVALRLTEQGIRVTERTDSQLSGTECVRLEAVRQSDCSVDEVRVAVMLFDDSVVQVRCEAPASDDNGTYFDELMQAVSVSDQGGDQLAARRRPPSSKLR